MTRSTPPRALAFAVAAVLALPAAATAAPSVATDQQLFDTGGITYPTDPAVWAPVGPRVRVVSPESPRGMEWLSVDRVREEVRALSADVAKLT